MGLLMCSAITGIGATVLIDLWSIVRKSLLGISPPDYGLVGRWIAHMVRGRLHHRSIAASAHIHGVRAIGWIAHYLIGIAYAAVLLSIWGLAWMQHPTVTPALVVGIGTVAAPFLLMQPSMGAGFFASRTPRPSAARMQSIIMHTVFGLGLFLTAWVTGQATDWSANF